MSDEFDAKTLIAGCDGRCYMGNASVA